MARRTFQGPRGRPADKTWDTIPGLEQAFAAAGTVIASGLLSFTEAQTVVRVRGSIRISFRSATVALDSMFMAIGLGVFSTDAVVASAFPDPAGDADYPWMWWKEIPMWSPFAIDGTGSDGYGLMTEYFELDCKAMRKVKQLETLCLVAQYVDNNGTPPVQLQVGVQRVLLLK